MVRSSDHKIFHTHSTSNSIGSRPTHSCNLHHSKETTNNQKGRENFARKLLGQSRSLSFLSFLINLF
uniref:Uncharacterized protein n=1 Tax=Arundo donax TaxID=35708 RepID=A0A0A9D2J7_ARUDO